MTSIQQAGAYALGDLTVNRLGYGAMQLAGPHVFGPPKDKAQALAVLREALELGINHIDTSDFYGPHITNQLIREALHPYRDDLVIVTKVGAENYAAKLAEEARRFMGLPDVTPINEALVAEMTNRMQKNLSMMSGENMMSSWMSVGTQAQDAFVKLMTSGVTAAAGAAAPREKP